MTKITALALALSLLWSLAFSCHAAADAQKILTASDAVRNPGRPFSVNVTLVEFQAGSRVDASSMVNYSRTMEEGGQFASIISFTQPARDAGKLMLKNGNDLWFYDPSTKATVRISPQQRLLGQAANGDVVTVNLARDYRATLLAEEEVSDGDRRVRKAYKLGLEPMTDDATYGRVELWVSVQGFSPIKGLFYADSGRLLKTVFYRRYSLQLGVERPTELVIIDGINPQSVTLMRLTDYTARSIPTRWFQREYLSRFQPEQ